MALDLSIGGPITGLVTALLNVITAKIERTTAALNAATTDEDKHALIQRQLEDEDRLNYLRNIGMRIIGYTPPVVVTIPAPPPK